MGGSMERITTADFIVMLERNLIKKEINQSSYKILFKEMPSIVEKINRTWPTGEFNSQLSIYNMGSDSVVVDHQNCLIAYRDGVIFTENFYINEERHSYDDKPALIHYHMNGLPRAKLWFSYGELTREDDKPSVMSYYETGEKEIEEWFQNETRIRSGNKPSFVKYSKDGTIIEEGF